jgi:hypothetical protein
MGPNICKVFGSTKFESGSASCSLAEDVETEPERGIALVLTGAGRELLLGAEHEVGVGKRVELSDLPRRFFAAAIAAAPLINYINQ